MQQGLIEQRNIVQAIPQQLQNIQVSQNNQANTQPVSSGDFNETLQELTADLSEIDDNVAVEHLKNWIET